MRNFPPPGYMRGMNQIPPAPFQPNFPCPPEGGYAMLSDNEMGSIEIGKTQQLYYSRPIAANPINPTAAEFFNPNTFYVDLSSGDISLKGERPWSVRINAIEVIRFGSEAPVPRLTSEQIISINEPRYSTLQAMIKVADGSANSKIIKVDVAGGTTIPVYGRNVQVGILSPANTQVIIDRDNPPANSLTGIVCNSIVSASIAPVVGSYGNFDILKFTWNQGVAAGASEFIEIPPSARRVRIINATTAVATNFMYFWIGNDAVNGHSMGIIDFVTTNDSLDINIPCGATHIWTGTPDEENERCFTFVFLIDP